MMTTSLGPHPEDGRLELYAIGNLPDSEACHLEKHLLACSQCQHRLEETDEFVAVIRRAAERLMDPIRWTHVTADGPIYLSVKREGDTWIAEFRGGMLEGAREFKTLKQANEFLLRAFADMYPEHRCTSKCGKSI